MIQVALVLTGVLGLVGVGLAAAMGQTDLAQAHALFSIACGILALNFKE